MHGPPPTPGNTEQSDDGEGVETYPEGWEIEIAAGDGTGGEQPLSSAIDIILNAAIRAQDGVVDAGSGFQSQPT